MHQTEVRVVSFVCRFGSDRHVKVIMNNLSPTWDAFTLPMSKLCNGDPNLTLLFQVFDWNKTGKEGVFVMLV